jgi:sugar-specific transcriptional regulator TrmB
MTLMPLSDKLIKELTSFGLAGNEAKVYLALLQLRKASARAIAKLSNIPRQEIYRVLPRLEELGAIEVIIDKPTKFMAINPDEVLSELIENQKGMLSKQITEMCEKKTALVNQLRKVEGKSAAQSEPEPVRFALISGQRPINEKIEEMLRNAKEEVLWITPKLEIRRATIYDRDKMLRKCAQRNVKIRVITEVDKQNMNEINQLRKFCEIRHSRGVTSLATIIDSNELIVGSAVHPSEGSTTNGLMHELWTNDSGHVSVMRDFFEKVWEISVPVELELKSLRSGKMLQTIVVVQGTENVKKQVLDSLTGVQSKLFIVSGVDDDSISFVKPQLETLRKRNVSIRWVTVGDKQSFAATRNLVRKFNLRFVEERPISFIVTDQECLFSSFPILQIPHEIVYSIDQNTVSTFWALAEEIWASLSTDTAELK